MADIKISELNSLAGADLVAADVVAVVDNSASETKKLTVSDLIANGTTLISDATIPSAKILFSAGAIDTAELAASAVETAKINDSAVTAAKLADNSSVTLVSALPASGDFTGQIALDTDDDKIYVWDGSAWDSVKGAGSINVVNGSTTGEINIVASTSGDTVTISATLDDTTAAAQFLGGPTGAAGTVGYRALVGSDLPTPTTSTKGGVIVNGEGLRMDSDTIEIDNDVTANSSTYQAVQFDSKGLITAGRDITAADLPEATSGAIGGVKPGSGLSMGSAGAINHSNSVTGATNTKITFDAQGHVTAGTNLAASDVPDLDTAKITTGTFPTARIADDAITAAKLGDRSTATIAETTPDGGAFIGQCHLNSITGDYFLWDGNVWQPIGISVGEIVLAGTYDANTNLVATVTSEGTAVGYEVGSALPAASDANKGYYVIVSEAGTGTSPAPTVALNPPDFLLSTGTAYTEIDVSDTVTAQQAENVAFTAAGNIASTNVQAAIEELDTEKAASASPTFTGTVALGEDAVITFEGATDNAFESTLTVVDPTADRTLSLPDVSGTLVSSGDTGTVTSTMLADGTIVNADISASAEIAVSKLANGSARQLLQTDSAGTGVEFTSNVDVPGTLDVTGAATLDSTLDVTGVISADGKVKFPAGTAAAPSFYSGTDTDTGLYFSAADEVSVATGGTQRVVVDSSGQVGIGTSSVNANLQVHNLSANSTLAINNGTVGSALTDGLTLISATDGSAFIAQRENADLIISTNNTERLRVDSSGNVGIGTTSPDNLLEIEDSSGGTSFSIHNTGTSGRQYILQSTSSSSSIGGGKFSIYDGDAPAHRFVLDSSGRVGIGTTSPGQLLEINGASSPCVLIKDTTNNVIAYTFADDSVANFGSASNHPVVFRVNNTERARIDSSGLGIGTSSPSANLHVVDSGENNIRFAGAASTVGTYVLLQNTDTTDGNSSILEGNDAQGQGVAQIQFINVNHTNNEGALAFNTRPSGGSTTEAMRIDSSQRLLVGTTSSSATSEDIEDSKGGIRAIPQNSETAAYTLVAADVGKHVSITTGGVTVPSGVFSAGDAISIYNDSASNQTITQGSSVTLRQVGTANTGNRTLAQRGLCTVLCVASNEFVVSGGGLS